jgi:anti-sigma factor RsiW
MEQHEHNEKCRELFAMISDYLNLELPPDACQEIESHLAGCAPCTEFVESLRRTVELCRAYRPEAMPAPISESARSQLLGAWHQMLAARDQKPVRD